MSKKLEGLAGMHYAKRQVPPKSHSLAGKARKLTNFYIIFFFFFLLENYICKFIDLFKLSIMVVQFTIKRP